MIEVTWLVASVLSISVCKTHYDGYKRSSVLVLRNIGAGTWYQVVYLSAGTPPAGNSTRYQHVRSAQRDLEL